MSHRRGHEMLRSTFHVEVRVGPAKRDAVKEADPVPGAVAALPGEPALLVQVEQVVLDLLGGDPLGTASLEAREPGDGVEIRAYRVLREAANGHVVDHAFAQTCHVSSPLSVTDYLVTAGVIVAPAAEPSPSECPRTVTENTGIDAPKCVRNRLEGYQGETETAETTTRTVKSRPSRPSGSGSRDGHPSAAERGSVQ